MRTRARPPGRVRRQAMGTGSIWVVSGSAAADGGPFDPVQRLYDPWVTATRALVRVSHHMFCLTDQEAFPQEYLPPTNGMLAVHPHAVVIFTGIHSGVASVAVEARDARPPRPDTDSWDEVVEVGVRAPTGYLKVIALMADPPDLPILSLAGPGDYRVRVHARGRDTMPDGVAFEPVEDYLLVVWSDPSRAEVIHKRSDAYGASLRRSAAAHRVPAARPETDEDRRQRLLTENLRRFSGRRGGRS